MKRARRREPRRLDDLWGERQEERGGRPQNRAPESVATARAYVIKRWGRPTFDRAAAVVQVELAQLAMWSTTNAINERYAKARELVERLSRAQPALRELLTLAGAAGISIFTETQAFRGALRTLRRRAEHLAENASVAGSAKDFRNTSAALDAYKSNPTPASRRRLDAAVRRPGLEARSTLVHAIRTRTAADDSATTWATWAIAIGIEDPCDSATLERERRKPWRDALKAAKFSGRTPRAK